MTILDQVSAVGKTGLAKILVVDDDERNLLALSEVLGSVAEVVTASSGRDALRLLLKDDFAVILLDVFMPGMDGYETAAFIRDREQTARVPIIFLSAVNKETEHLMRGYEMGAVDYVFKPVEPMMLKSKVAVFVDLYMVRKQVEHQAEAEHVLREAHYREQFERLKIERELKESELRQARILGTLPMALYEAELDDAGRLRRRFIGGDIARLLGEANYNPGDYDCWEDRIHVEDRERIEGDARADYRNGDGAITLEYRWQCANGAMRYFMDQRVASAGTADGARWVGTLVDITERKKLEAQLVHAGKVDALGQLTGGVAHDFNNLLAAVLGGISVLERRLEMGDKEKFIIEQMRHAAERGAELVRRMMAFARQQDLFPVSVDPEALCNSVAGLVSHTLGGKTVIDWHCTPQKLNLFIDRAQLELAMMNLILNARDAMPEGGRVVITIESCTEAELPAVRVNGAPYLRIRVADEGRGIPDHLIAKITEPFFTTKQAGKGTGLGLSMVAGFVQQSGGELRIESRVDQGTIIDLILPATFNQTDKVLAGDFTENRKLANKSLLLIDDDEAVRIVLREQLRDLDVNVDDFSSGTAAIEALAKTKKSYDYILSDFAMPGLDGVQTLAQLRDLVPGAQTALMTGYADEIALSAIKPSVPIIRKPLDLGKISSELFG